MKMSGQIKVAAIQMVSSEDWKKNIKIAEDLIIEAKQAGAELIILPEFFICISKDHNENFNCLIEELGNGNIQTKLSEMAKKYAIYLVAGTVPIKSDVPNRCYNTMIVYDPQGKMICHYHKIHLFRLDDPQASFDESNTFTPGNEVVTFEINGFKFGLAICYDLRFPELFRKMGHIDAIILPAAFLHSTGQYHWEILLRARAIENLCYVIGSNQGGMHEAGRETFGHSMIIDPWGEIASIMVNVGEGFITGIISKDKIFEIRSKLPALKHKKL